MRATGQHPKIQAPHAGSTFFGKMLRGRRWGQSEVRRKKVQYRFKVTGSEKVFSECVSWQSSWSHRSDTVRSSGTFDVKQMWAPLTFWRCFFESSFTQLVSSLLIVKEVYDSDIAATILMPDNKYYCQKVIITIPLMLCFTISLLAFSVRQGPTSHHLHLTHVCPCMDTRIRHANFVIFDHSQSPSCHQFVHFSFTFTVRFASKVGGATLSLLSLKSQCLPYG